MNLKHYLREVPDFPKAGINFIDITTLVKNPTALMDSVGQISDPWKDKGITAVVGIESRGFIFGGAVAVHLGVGFVPIRKPGKLPSATLSESYELEYGSDSVEIHRDALSPADTVLLIDDLLATGGTMQASIKLVQKTGATVAGISFLAELTFLNGREKLGGYKISSLVKY